MAKSIPGFALIFGAVCGLEFSVNDRIHKSFGTFAGLAASGFTGALFLTAADHLMFRQHHKQNFFRSFTDLAGLRLFTGFIPMMMRESIFIANVAYIGPATGKLMNKFFNNKNESDASYDFYGRLASGLFTTFISQPFDSLARSLQHRHLHN
jgi:purine-cytosine permease-like protein